MTEKTNKKLYIILTNSLQNDFLEKLDNTKKKYPKKTDIKLSYKFCRKKWIEYFDKKNISKNDKSIEGFLEEFNKEIRSKPEIEQGVDYSYHNILNYYKHMVHIDDSESERIWSEEGVDLEQAFNDLIERAKEANNGKEERYYFIHIRDWHDPTNINQLYELQNFGFHCIKGSYGAEFIKPIKTLVETEDLEEYNIIIDSNSLSCFANTELNGVLTSIIKKERPTQQEVHLGIFGLITNVKIKLLVYELNEIYGFENITVCEDLCAGFYNKGHIDGLEYIRNVFGVKILPFFDSEDEKGFKSKFRL